MADLFAIFLNIKYASTMVYQNTIIYNVVVFNNSIYETVVLDIIQNRLILKLWLKQPSFEQYNNPNLTYCIENNIQYEHNINQQYLHNALREKLKDEQSEKEAKLKHEQEILRKEEQLSQYEKERKKIRNEYKYLVQEYINPIEDFMYKSRQISAKDKITPEILFEITGNVSINFKLNESKIVYKLYIKSGRSYLNFRKDDFDCPASLNIINKIKPQLKIFYNMTVEHIDLTKKINVIKNSLEESV